MTESLEDLSASWRAAWSAGRYEAFADLCTADVQYEDPLAVDPLQGIEALAGHAADGLRTFPDLTLEATGPPLGDGGRACLPWRALGTQRGPVGDLPATGERLALHGVHYVELEHGRVRRARGFFDLNDAAMQLGLAPRRGTFAERAVLMLQGFGLRAPR